MGVNNARARGILPYLNDFYYNIPVVALVVGGRLNYEVLIVGASSAGLYAAELLAAKGKRVAVLERSVEIDPQERTYIITPAIYQVVDEFPSELVQQKIEQFQIQSGDHQAEIPLSAPDLIVDRADLITSLAARARAAGVEILADCDFTGFESRQGKTLLKVNHQGAVKFLSADYLIGADGVHSAVRRSLGLEPIPSVPLLQAVIDLPDGWDPKTTKVWFDIEATPYFYWMIPRNKHQAVVGLIAQQNADIQGLLEDFLAQNQFKPDTYQSGQAALHARNSSTEFTLGDLAVMLVGDAAGQVKVTTVGGTVTGFVGALDAVNRILGLNSQHGKKELNLHHYIRRLLNQMAPGDYENLIIMLNPSVTSFLSRHDRDNMRSHFWKLAVLQPQFIPLGLKLVSRSILNGSN